MKGGQSDVKIQLVTARFEDEGEITSQGMQAVWESGKSKEVDSPLKLLKGMYPCWSFLEFQSPFPSPIRVIIK